jgi:hypothetical protein
MWMRYIVLLMLLLAGCASSPQQVSPPKIQRISPEELERIMPKPVPTVSLDEIVRLSRAGAPPPAIVEKIRQSGSTYSLAPSQMIDLSHKGVDSAVLDYLFTSREQILREGYADEINRRESEYRAELERMQQELMQQRAFSCDPFWWGYPYPWGYYRHGFSCW